MDIILDDATLEMRRWYDGWFKDNFKHLSRSFSSEECVSISKLADSVYINARFAIVIDGDASNTLFRKLCYGTRFTPKIPLDDLINAYLWQIYPKYRDAVECYLFVTTA